LRFASSEPAAQVSTLNNEGEGEFTGVAILSKTAVRKMLSGRCVAAAVFAFAVLFGLGPSASDDDGDAVCSVALGRCLYLSCPTRLEVET
jgi:hypothetical protein